MSLILRAAFALLSCLFAAATAVAAGTVAFVTDLKGDVSIDGSGRPLLLGELMAGQKLRLGADSQLTVMFGATGKEYVLSGPGSYELDERGVQAVSGKPAVERATPWRSDPKVVVQVSRAAAASVRMRSVAAPQAAAPRLSFPTEGRIATLRPTFEWKAPGDRGPVRIEVYLPGREAPYQAADVSGTSYRFEQPLAADTEYAWTVRVAGDEIGSARFRTLPTASLAQIEQQRPDERAAFSDRVAYALMLHEAGAKQEAQHEWRRLARARSDLPELEALGR